MLPCLMTVAINTDHLAEAVLVKFLHHKVTLFPPFHNLLFESKLLHSSPLGRSSGYINYLEFCKEDLSFLPICLFVCL